MKKLNLVSLSFLAFICATGSNAGYITTEYTCIGPYEYRDEEVHKDTIRELQITRYDNGTLFILLGAHDANSSTDDHSVTETNTQIIGKSKGYDGAKVFIRFDKVDKKALMVVNWSGGIRNKFEGECY